MSREKYCLYLHTIQKAVTWEPEQSAKEAICRAYGRHGERWEKLPLFRRQLALNELNQKIEQALQESADQQRGYRQEAFESERKNKFAMPSP